MHSQDVEWLSMPAERDSSSKRRNRSLSLENAAGNTLIATSLPSRLSAAQ
jgi:hypothetical protein